VLLSQEVEEHKRREGREWALKRLRFCGGGIYEMDLIFYFWT